MSFIINPYVFAGEGSSPPVEAAVDYLAALRATRTTDQSGISDGFVDNFILFNSEVFDDGWGWDPSADPGKFTVPAGTTFVVVTAMSQQVLDGGRGDAGLAVLVNSSEVLYQVLDEQFRQDCDLSGIIEVSASDTIEIVLRTNDTDDIIAGVFVSLTAYGPAP